MKATTKNAMKMAKKLTPEVNTLLLATAVAEAEREACDQIQRRLLDAREYFVSERWERLPEAGKRITEPKDAYLMSDTCAAEYYAAMDAAYAAAGYELKPGYCPALIAERIKTQAEWALIEAAQEWFPECDNDRLLCGTGKGDGLEMRRKYLDLLIKLVVNFPGYQPPTI